MENLKRKLVKEQAVKKRKEARMKKLRKLNKKMAWPEERLIDVEMRSPLALPLRGKPSQSL